ncbi:MAG TPA: TIGR01777 family oxidoreductase [Terracidiphilus sp.]|nr:TIGR01777 family oxidoreductase [Terracidiphilus sp.]
MYPVFNVPLRPLRIVLPGGSGQVGRMLAAYFQQRGHHVTVLTRLPYAAMWQTVHWDGENPGPWTEYLEGADVCINLAGRSVNCRYTKANRAAIYSSRVRSTRILGEVIASLTGPPRVWLNASTATIYRHALDRSMDEATGELGGREWITPHRRAPDTWNFSVGVARDWEAAFFAAETPATRKVALRSAITLSPVTGNAFAILLNLVRFSLGGTQGNGRQFVSWIHELDFARAVEFLIARDDLDGPVNIASPHPLPNREFMAVLRDAWGMPNGFPAPAPLVELAAIFLRTESELALKSRRVVPGRLLDAGFQFEFPGWPEASQDLVGRWRHRFD